MKRTITAFTCAVAAALALSAAAEHKRRYPELPEKITAETPAQRDARMAWWRDARFGMFIHFGLYAAPARHEWVRSVEAIDNETYDSKYLPRFNPDLFDADEWAAQANCFAVVTAYALAFRRRGGNGGVR